MNKKYSVDEVIKHYEDRIQFLHDQFVNANKIANKVLVLSIVVQECKQWKNVANPAGTIEAQILKKSIVLSNDVLQGRFRGSHGTVPTVLMYNKVLDELAILFGRQGFLNEYNNPDKWNQEWVNMIDTI